MSRTISNCPACGATTQSVVVGDSPEARRRFLLFSDTRYGGAMNEWLSDIELCVLCCEACGHFWYRQQPSREQLIEMYAATGQRYASSQAALAPSKRTMHQVKRLYQLCRSQCAGSSVEAPTLLDYGAGRGIWSLAAVQAGFDVTAFEPSAARSDDTSQDKHGFRTVNDLAAIGNMVFDAVNLEQVLEHIDDPYAALLELRSHCHSSTVVRIAVPNLNRSFEGGALWNDWPFDGKRPHTMAPFEHLQGFVPGSLRELSRRAGYCEVPIGKAVLADPVFGVRRMLRKYLPMIDTTSVFLVPRGSN